jgi:hypothetical protein
MTVSIREAIAQGATGSQHLHVRPCPTAGHAWPDFGQSANQKTADYTAICLDTRGSYSHGVPVPRRPNIATTHAVT